MSLNARLDEADTSGLTFSERLRIVLKEWEKTHPDASQTVIAEEVAAILGEEVNQRKVSRWFNGQDANFRELDALAEFFRVDPGWLATGKVPRLRPGRRFRGQGDEDAEQQAG